MTKAQQRILADGRVRSADDESALGDGFWVYLRTGWCVAPGQHIIHEPSWTACLRELRSEVRRCDCCECVQPPK